MKKTNAIQWLMMLLLVSLFGCTKEAGEGGNSSIRGRLQKEIRLVLTNPATYQYTVDAADEDVMILYGDHVSPDNDVKTNFQGEYEFLNLRKGKYTLYVYSRDTSGVSGVDPNHMVIRQEVEITDKNQQITVPVFTVYETP